MVMGADSKGHSDADDGDLAADEQQFIIEVAGALAAWPARNPVMRQALDRAGLDLLVLARDQQADRSVRGLRG